MQGRGRNNFPICTALSFGTTGGAGGYVRDGKSVPGEVISGPFRRGGNGKFGGVVKEGICP